MSESNHPDQGRANNIVAKMVANIRQLLPNFPADAISIVFDSQDGQTFAIHYDPEKIPEHSIYSLNYTLCTWHNKTIEQELENDASDLTYLDLFEAYAARKFAYDFFVINTMLLQINDDITEAIQNLPGEENPDTKVSLTIPLQNGRLGIKHENVSENSLRYLSMILEKIPMNVTLTSLHAYTSRNDKEQSDLERDLKHIEYDEPLSERKFDINGVPLDIYLNEILTPLTKSQGDELDSFIGDHNPYSHPQDGLDAAYDDQEPWPANPSFEVTDAIAQIGLDFEETFYGIVSKRVRDGEMTIPEPLESMKISLINILNSQLPSGSDRRVRAEDIIDAPYKPGTLHITIENCLDAGAFRLLENALIPLGGECKYYPHQSTILFERISSLDTINTILSELAKDLGDSSPPAPEQNATTETAEAITTKRAEAEDALNEIFSRRTNNTSRKVVSLGPLEENVTTDPTLDSKLTFNMPLSPQEKDIFKASLYILMNHEVDIQGTRSEPGSFYTNLEKLHDIVIRQTIALNTKLDKAIDGMESQDPPSF